MGVNIKKSCVQIHFPIQELWQKIANEFKCPVVNQQDGAPIFSDACKGLVKSGS